jgi:hypothetical protein
VSRLDGCDWFCLIYEHDGDIIPDLIEEFAMVADEPISFLVQVNFSLALGAGENI